MLSVFRSAGPLCRIAHKLPNIKYLRLHRQFSSKLSSRVQRFVKISEEVENALATAKPIVALESTIYTHGFPYPQNALLAKNLEAIVREEGAVPATIGVLNGVARIGLNEKDLLELASAAQRGPVMKVSRRELPYIAGLGFNGKPIHGGTTVAGTSVLAAMAGIRVFATGGLGGVHRHGENTMDVSADLVELGRTPIAVVSSGCKSFLDIPRTLEYLETQGVMVGVFADGRTEKIDFPAFYTRNSGLKAPKVVLNEADAAAMIFAQHGMGLSSGLLLANPVPEEHALPKKEMDIIIAQALVEADRAGITGNENTPFILAKIKEMTGGRSVSSNTAIAQANVQRGSRVAVELAKLHESERPVPRNPKTASFPERKESSVGFGHEEVLETKQIFKPKARTTGGVLVAGSLAIDSSCDHTPQIAKAGQKPILGSSNPAVIRQSLGGVGYNVALATHYMGIPATFCSVVADDLSGQKALAELEDLKISTRGVQVLDSAMTNAKTAEYVAMNDMNKNLVLAMADMSILELPDEKLSFERFWSPIVEDTSPSWTVIDANWSSRVLSKWLRHAKKIGSKVAFEPVSVPKSRRIFALNDPFSSPSHGRTSPAINLSDVVPHHLIDVATPNVYELSEMWCAARDLGLLESEAWFEIVDQLGFPSSGIRNQLVSLTGTEYVNMGVPQQSIQLLPFIPNLITKLGPQGVLLTQLLPTEDPRLTSRFHAKYIVGRGRNTRDNHHGGGVYMRLFSPATRIPDKDVISVNGAGDTMLGAIIAGLVINKSRGLERLDDILSVAQKASVLTLRDSASVAPVISELREELAALASR